MKRKYFIFLLVVVLLCLTGCSGGTSYPADDSYHFETDCQYSLSNQGFAAFFAESPDGYYFMLTVQEDDYMFFADKATMQAVPLCGKPNCLHFEETNTDKKELCNARFMPSWFTGTVYFYNENLYVPTTSISNNKTLYPILEVSPDGAGRKMLWELDAAPSGDNLVFHRGYMYLAESAYDENMKVRLEIQRYSLDNPSQKPEILFEKTLDREDGGGNVRLIYDMKAYGNHLYFTTIEDSETAFYTIDLTNPASSCEKFLEKLGEDGTQPYYIAPSDGALLSAMTNVGETQNLSGIEAIKSVTRTLYRTDLDGGNPQAILKLSSGPYTSDGRYIYHWPLWVLWKDGSIDRHSIRIYDLEGNLLADHDAAGDAPDFRDLYVTPGEHVFLNVQDNNKVYYFAKSEIETGEIHPKLLIDCSQYE